MDFLKRRNQRKRRKYSDYGTTFNSKGFSVYSQGLQIRHPISHRGCGMLWVAERMKILPGSGFLKFCGFEQDPYCDLDLGFVVNI